MHLNANQSKSNSLLTGILHDTSQSASNAPVRQSKVLMSGPKMPKSDMKVGHIGSMDEGVESCADTIRLKIKPLNLALVTDNQQETILEACCSK